MHRDPNEDTRLAEVLHEVRVTARATAAISQSLLERVQELLELLEQAAK